MYSMLDWEMKPVIIEKDNFSVWTVFCFPYKAALSQHLIPFAEKFASYTNKPVVWCCQMINSFINKINKTKH